jgi:hypothetical protein
VDASSLKFGAIQQEKTTSIWLSKDPDGKAFSEVDPNGGKILGFCKFSIEEVDTREMVNQGISVLRGANF